MTPATIYLDANPLADKHLTGIGRYTARLALALARHTRPRFFSNGTELILPVDLDWSPDQDLAHWGRRVWKSRRRPFTAPPADSVGVYPCLRPVEKLFPFEISILHDFTPQVVPYTHSERTRGMFHGFYAKSLLSSDAALAVSHNTRADASWLTDFDQARIRVAHSGPSLCVESHRSHAKVARRPNVGLVVSTLEPRKNAFFLLDWFRETQVLPEGSELWWVGPLGWLTSRKDLRRFTSGLRDRRIRFLGVVSDTRLCRLYQTAGWTIYPSLYEGFGFPVLDALRHGAPVLCSYNSSLREFDVPGLEFFDPCDRSTVDDAYRRFRDVAPTLPTSSELDSRYSWDLVARALLDLVPSTHVEETGLGQAA